MNNSLSEAALQADIDDLRKRFTETRILYKELCGLLFFRYGVTPTANRLYALLKKGSMNVPSEVLQQFWQELRERTRVKIDHPSLPEPLKQLAADMVMSLWEASTKTAAAELAEQRVAARKMVEAADARREHAEMALAEVQRELSGAHDSLNEATHLTNGLRAELNSERTRHSATEARLQEMRHQVEERDRLLAEARAQLSAELEKARKQLTQEQERSAEAERHVRLELDRERTLRRKTEGVVDELRTELSTTKTEQRNEAVKQAAAAARAQTELQATQQRLTNAVQERESQRTQLANLRQELQSAQKSMYEALGRAAQAEAEVLVTRKLVEDFKLAQAPKSKGAS